MCGWYQCKGSLDRSHPFPPPYLLPEPIFASSSAPQLIRSPAETLFCKRSLS